jgi:hypothetical protein
MWKKVLIAFAAIVAIFLVLAAMQPDTFRISRSATMAAPPEVVFAEVNDFHNWGGWNPWQKVDPAAKYTYSGADSGEGAKFAWDGNDDVGAGRMTITDSEPPRRVGIELEFLRPFAATNQAEFTFEPQAGGTVVTWSMTGVNTFLSKVFGLLLDMDTMVGGEFEKGLSDMKAIVERKSS